MQIFGPVLSVGKFSTEEEAIALANDTNYGLGAGLHSSMLFQLNLKYAHFTLFPFKTTPTNACVFRPPLKLARCVTLLDLIKEA